MYSRSSSAAMRLATAPSTPESTLALSESFRPSIWRLHVRMFSPQKVSSVDITGRKGSSIMEACPNTSAGTSAAKQAHLKADALRYS